MTTNGMPTPTEVRLENNNFQITGGSTRGSNLFHSFNQFSIDVDESATFSGHASVENIISRVTGGDFSTIDGTLRSEINGANLFLLNPAGVIFGENVSLDISGSLHVSSADYLSLGDDGDVFRVALSENSILSAAAPAAFGFVGGDMGSIRLQGAGLSLPGSETPTIAANSIELDNAELNIDQGAVQMISLASGGEVSIATGDADFADIDMVDQSTINVDGMGGGRVLMQGGNIQLHHATVSADTLGDRDATGISIQATNLELLNSGVITSDTLGTGNAGVISIQTGDMELLEGAQIASGTFGEGHAGAIDIETGRLRIDGNGLDQDTGLFSEAEEGSSGNAGTIVIQATDVDLKDSVIKSSVVNTGLGGTVELTSRSLTLDQSSILTDSGDSASAAGSVALAVTGDISLSNGAGITSSSSGAGSAGSVLVVTAGDVVLDAAKIQSSNSGTGDAGEVSLYALDSISEFIAADGSLDQTALSEIDADEVTGSGKISLANGASLATETVDGENPALIELMAGDLVLDNDSRITTNTSGAGDAGLVLVNAGRLLIDGSKISSTNGENSTGNAGNILLTGGSVTLANDSLIDSANFGVGNAGNILVNAGGDVTLSGGSLVGTETFKGDGNAGSITISAAAMLLDKGSITSEGSGDGAAGIIVIKVAGDVSLNQFSITTKTDDGFDPENPASIELTAGNLLLDGSSRITTDADGKADAGSIDLRVIDTIRIQNDSRLSTESSGGGGGVIDVFVNDFLYLQDSAITTNVGLGGGDGGDITVDPVFIVLDGSRITANAIDGNGGDIDLTANSPVNPKAMG